MAYLKINNLILSGSTQSVTSDGVYNKFKQFRDNDKLLPVTHFKLEPGGITDQLEVTTKTGAMSAATITKSGSCDNIVVLSGDYNSYIAFPNIIINDNQAIFKAKIRTDIVGSGSCYFGLGTIGTATTLDTSVGINRLMTVDLVGKTIYRQSKTTFGIITGTSSTGGTLAYNNSILEVEMRLDSKVGGLVLTVLNTNNGEWLMSTYINGSVELGTGAGYLRLNMQNGSFTILDLSVMSHCKFNPDIHIIGDSYGSGYNRSQSHTLKGYLESYSDLSVCESAGNGAYIINVANLQIRDVIRYKPKYVVLVSILSVYYGYFNSGDANQTVFDASMAKLMGAIIACGSIPVMIKWPAGGYSNGHDVTWATYVDNLVLAYPTTLVVNLRSYTFNYNDNSHPNDADNAIIAAVIYNTIIANNPI